MDICDDARMDFLRRMAKLIQAALTPPTPADNADGHCQHCKKFVLADDGIITMRALYCSDYCVEQDFGHQFI